MQDPSHEIREDFCRRAWTRIKQTSRENLYAPPVTCFIPYPGSVIHLGQWNLKIAENFPSSPGAKANRQPSRGREFAVVAAHSYSVGLPLLDV
ncbi:hypothetical protein E1B28_009295 [Marasmius oreades]|uniref:Uncharacterized protein n=1 Tax=Marasmius oreades TaxID=181124 RepID=A0A9P7S069_9AGAR|nr:uncharacterized protein E1B28_009295 [Marasmius oreades]KAG7092996.1 hypothetical protein E1B28_009295 [Marasmius oreades]